MKRKRKTDLYISICAFAAFLIWTQLVRFVDVQAIGPRDSSVGFATVNQFIHNLTGVHMLVYHITDWLGLVPVAFGFGFTILGLVQWIGRRSILRVDADILILGAFYLVVMGAYLFFESVVINYRPVLINGFLEASYPSSTTLLVLCVMPSAMMQFNHRIKHNAFRKCTAISITAFILFMVLGRLTCGVHWFSDIVGGGLLSTGLVMLYRFFSRLGNANCK